MPTRKAPARRRRRTARPVRAAAQRAVERVLSSEESFALLIRKLQDAGWHIERPTSGAHASEPLTPRERAR